MPYLPDVSEGQRPSAKWTNELKDIASHEHAGAVGYSDDEHTVIPIYSSESLDLYQLTGAPELDDTAREYKATAKPCKRRICAIDGDGHVTGVGTFGGGPTRWVISPTARDETIWFPACNRDSNAEPLAAPTATTGDRVWTAVIYSKRQVVTMAGQKARRCSAILAADAAPSATINVDNVVVLDGGTSPLDDPDDTTETIEATMPPDARALDNATCIIEWDENADAWKITWVHERARRCSAALAADGTPGASVNVDTIVALDGGQTPTVTSATMPAGQRALDNAPCLIEWDENGDAWKIVWVQQQAKMIRGTLSGALATSDPSITITSPVSCDGGQVPTGTVTGYNVFSHEGDSGGEIYAVWNETTDHYEFMQVECPS